MDQIVFVKKYPCLVRGFRMKWVIFSVIFLGLPIGLIFTDINPRIICLGVFVVSTLLMIIDIDLLQ